MIRAGILQSHHAIIGPNPSEAVKKVQQRCEIPLICRFYTFLWSTYYLKHSDFNHSTLSGIYDLSRNDIDFAALSLHH
jgi:hypothetical protein